jgi:ketol-acid reductoisomerase
MKIFRDKHADLKLLRKEAILVLGYGSQGQAFALNMQDSGLNVTVCLKSSSKSIPAVISNGLPVITPNKIADHDSVIIFCIPDHIQGDFYDRYLKNKISPGSTLVFVHSYAIHFSLIDPLPHSDIVLVAPHGPGQDLRETYLDKTGLSCFVAEHQDISGLALKKSLAVAKAIGATRAGAFLTTFKEEAIGDLFGEQVLLCGGLAELIEKAYLILIKNGVSRENAYIETVHQIDLLASLIKKHGIHGMTERISKTAQFGMLKTSGKIIDSKAEERLQRIFNDIKTGKFAVNWQNEYKKGLTELKTYKKSLKQSDLEKASKRMRNLLNE